MLTMLVCSAVNLVELGIMPTQITCSLCLELMCPKRSWCRNLGGRGQQGHYTPEGVSVVRCGEEKSRGASRPA